MYAWLPRDVRYEHADRRRHELAAGQKLETGRSLYSRSGRHRLEMGLDGNVIEWGTALSPCKTDTERTGKKNYFTLESDGELVVRKGDNELVKVVDRVGSVRPWLACVADSEVRCAGEAGKDARQAVGLASRHKRG